MQKVWRAAISVKICIVYQLFINKNNLQSHVEPASDCSRRQKEKKSARFIVLDST